MDSESQQRACACTAHAATDGTSATGNSHNGQDAAHHDLSRRLEEAILEASIHRSRFQELFEFSPNGYVITDSHGMVVEVNLAAVALLGGRKEFLLEKPFAGFFEESSHRAICNRLSECGLAPASPEWEAKLGWSHGPERDVLVSVVPMQSGARELTTLLWQLRDVSHLRTTQHALLTEKRLADSLLESAEAVILVIGASGRVVRSNPYLQRISGFQDADLFGRDWVSLLIASEDRPAARRLVDIALRNGMARSEILWLTTRDGQRRAITWSAREFDMSPGRALALLGHDVTELREAQQQALQVERLAAIGQTAAALAHESRNALQRSRSCLTLLSLRLQDNPEALDLLGRLEEAHNDLYRLAEDVRGFAAPVHIERRPCDLAAVWQEAWQDLAPVRVHRPTELCELTDIADRTCYADPFRLKQVFRNLFENSLTSGVESVTIEVRCSEAVIDNRPAVRISVRDNGPGFSAEQRKRAFEAFYTTKFRGTGLGLAICRRVVEAHGGSIEIGQPAQPGAEVIVMLPRSAL